jgi:hypothetical protein
VVSGILLILACGVGVILVCQRCQARGGLYAMLAGEGVKGSYGTASKMWSNGVNTTDELRVEIMGGRQSEHAATTADCECQGGRNLLMQLHHPFILPTFDAAVSLDQQIFVLRPFSED